MPVHSIPTRLQGLSLHTFLRSNHLPRCGRHRRYRKPKNSVLMWQSCGHEQAEAPGGGAEAEAGAAGPPEHLQGRPAGHRPHQEGPREDQVRLASILHTHVKICPLNLTNHASCTLVLHLTASYFVLA